jgi:hypothetical protein
MRWKRLDYPDDGECCICERPTADLYEPVECSDTEEALIWAMVSPAGTAGVACCPLCIDHGIFNRLVSIELTLDKWKPILDFLTKQGVPFRVDEFPGKEEHVPLPSDQGSKRRVEFYSKQEPAFLEKLATLIK